MLEKPVGINLALIDDEEDFLLITESFLKKKNKGYITKTFSSPVEFLNFLEKTQKTFDVIISDYEMPDMNGLEMLSHIKSNDHSCSKTPFIMVTGKGRSEIIIDALNLGVDYYLEKSLDIESMYSELDHFISKASEKKFVEKELEELEEIYKTLVKLSPEGILIQVNFEIKFANPSIIRYLGYENESELIGKSIFDIIAPTYHKSIQKRIPQILNNIEMPFENVDLIKKDKSIVNCEATGRAIKYKSQNGIIVYYRKMEYE